MHLTATASRATTLLTKNPALFCRVMLAKLNTSAAHAAAARAETHRQCRF